MIYASTQPTEEAFRAAQEVLDTHTTQTSTGRCRVCDTYGPCYKREGAVHVFSRYSRLPVRTPGLSCPELVGARRVR